MQKNMQLYQKTKKALRNISQDFFGIATVIGVTGFEPAASWSRTKHSTGLSHTPIACILYHNAAGLSIAFAKKLAFPCTVVNDKLQKTQKIKTQARGDQKRWI